MSKVGAAKRGLKTGTELAGAERNYVLSVHGGELRKRRWWPVMMIADVVMMIWVSIVVAFLANQRLELITVRHYFIHAFRFFINQR